MPAASTPPARSSIEMAPATAISSTELTQAPTNEAKDGLAALAAINTPTAATKPEPKPELQPDGRYKLTEEAGYKHTGFSFPSWKKWWIITTIFIVQLSMNWNAAIYGNAIPGLKEEFGVDDFLVRIGQMVFLVAYAFGCELWAPWSEELGRKWVLQGSLFLVNIWQIGCALAPNFTSVIIFRGLGGLSSAGGSVTLGMVSAPYLDTGRCAGANIQRLRIFSCYCAGDADIRPGRRHVGTCRASVRCRVCIAASPELIESR